MLMEGMAYVVVVKAMLTGFSSDAVESSVSLQPVGQAGLVVQMRLLLGRRAVCCGVPRGGDW